MVSTGISGIGHGLEHGHDRRFVDRLFADRRHERRSYTRSSASAIPWPTPMHMVASASLPPVRCSSSVAVSASRAPDMPSGWPSAIAPPLGFTRGVVVGEAELAKHGEALGGEGLVQLDHVEVADLEAEALHQLLGRGRRADAHDPRRNAGDGGAEHAGARASGRCAWPLLRRR